MKLAFLFLSYGDIEQTTLWNNFFKDAKSNQHVIYLHMAHGGTTTAINGCKLIPTQPTVWGGFSLVKVQQTLLTAAFSDTDTTKFILLSGDCIPLYPFDKIYAQLTANDKGYMNYTSTPTVSILNINHPREAAINTAAWPVDRPWTWLKASQWSILNRTHVRLLEENWTMIVDVFRKMHVPDEHAYCIFFNGWGLLDTFYSESHMFDNRRAHSHACSIKHRSLPKTYHTSEITSSFHRQIYSSGFLFMRKMCKNDTFECPLKSAD